MSKPRSGDLQDTGNPDGGLGGGLFSDASSVRDGQQFCGDIDMRIARDGTWFYHGSPIGRIQLVKLFASVLRRDAAGDYWLETPIEKCRITVDDAPFLAVEMTVEGVGCDQCLGFRTSTDENVIAGAAHRIRVETDPRTGEPSPYVAIRDGLDALISRAVFYDLVELGVEETEEGATRFGVWSDGVFFLLGDPGSG
jgi:hypothetical protein